MVLAGCAEIKTTIRAVNEGNIFRFLSKPCPIKVLDKAIAELMENRGVFYDTEISDVALNLLNGKKFNFE